MLKLGETRPFGGYITTLNWIGPQTTDYLKDSLGLHPSRLAQGWHILLLKQHLTANDFTFEGTTLNSGGKYGLAAATPAADLLRPRVHDKSLTGKGGR